MASGSRSGVAGAFEVLRAFPEADAVRLAQSVEASVFQYEKAFSEADFRKRF